MESRTPALAGVKSRLAIFTGLHLYSKATITRTEINQEQPECFRGAMTKPQSQPAADEDGLDKLVTDYIELITDSKGLEEIEDNVLEVYTDMGGAFPEVS
ncbi:hypothetical protein CSUB01_06222 [Colletotrichum sublineola]|uniref:Uncharacterized protein n=1 Tax=Colletotrichum sublineola TaxID=1173701 RepID=A0A066Y261_COLSU|nr:hypothetical protein CSUB01_06222 [Colletotrichum sublineola]